MPTVTDKNVQIRWMIRRDMPEVLEIDHGGEFPWSESDFLDALRQRNCVGLVAERGEIVIGFMIYEMHDKYFGINKLTIHSSYRRQGIGAHLVQRLIGKLGTYSGSQRRTQIKCVIPESNLAGQLFLRDCGFRALSIWPKYYGGEDGYYMRYRIGGQ